MTKYLNFKRGGGFVECPKNFSEFAGNAFLPSVAFIPMYCGKKTCPPPIISRGEAIREGQLIIRGDGTSFAHSHSSIPGFVYDFVNFDLPKGNVIYAAAVKLSGSFDILGRTAARYSWQNSSPSEIINVIEAAGIVNTALQTPAPLAYTLRSFLKQNLSTLYFRLFDGDQSRGLSQILFNTFYDKVISGIGAIVKAVNPHSVICVHKLNKQDMHKLDTIKDVCANSDVKFVKAQDTYPFIERGTLNGKNTFALLDIPSVVYASEAVSTNNPMTSVYVHISGKAVNESKILKARIGTPIGCLIEECGGFKYTPSHIILNGLMNGIRIDNLDIPVTKSLQTIQILGKESVKFYNATSCINCGACFNACPVYLNPKKLFQSIRKNEMSSDVIKSIRICRKCSCCSACCPSRIPITAIIEEAAENIKKGEI